MTDYYTIFKFVESRKKVAKVREYLLDQINLQIIDVLATKNNVKTKAALRLTGYLSSDEIQNMFELFRDGKMQKKEILNKLSADMIGQSIQ